MGLPIHLFAEVMDKEPGIGTIWLAAIGLSVLAAALTRFRWWLGLLTLPITFGLINGVIDPNLGTALRREAGNGYIVQAFAAFAMCVGTHIIGMYSSIRHRRNVRRM